MDRFSDLLVDEGYNLIPQIRSKLPDSVIIGTSSMKEELQNLPRPDHSLNKLGLYTPDDELAPLLRSLFNK